MKVESQRERIRTVAERWRSAWGSETHRRLNPERLALADKLEALGLETATKEQVDSVIGNRGWSMPMTCDECSADDGRPVVQLGNEPDYDSNTAWICSACLQQALLLISKEAA